MAKEHDAALSIKRVVVQLEGFMQASKLLDEIGDAKQLRDECKTQAEEARAERDKAREEVVQAKAEVKKAKDQAKQILDGAVADANDAAERLQKAAEEQHAEIVKRAQDMSAAMLEQAATDRARATAEITKLQETAQALKTEIVALQNAKQEVINQYDDADKKLAALKSKLKALMD